MRPLVREVIIPEGDHQKIEIDLPVGFPAGKAIVTITLESDTPSTRRVNRAAEIMGKGEGKMWMAEDFDAPLEGFEEYM